MQSLMRSIRSYSKTQDSMHEHLEYNETNQQHFEGYECECISYAKQWLTLKEAIWFIEECDDPDEFEVVEIEVSYREIGVAE